MTEREQREEIYRIAAELLRVSDSPPPFPWKMAVRLRNELGDCLRTDAMKAKRERYNAKKAARKAARSRE